VRSTLQRVGTHLLTEVLWMLRADGWWCIDASAAIQPQAQ